MKTRLVARAALSILLILVSTSTLSRAAQPSAEALFKSGLYEEEVRGDLPKAIAIYQDLLKRFPESREAAAKAQLHIGLCYEKLGTAEAEKAFQKVVDNYPEQSAAVREAKEKLSTLSRSRAAAKTSASEFKLRQIWAGPEVDIDGAVSPDGRYLSFVDWKTGDVALRDLISGTSRRLTNKGSLTQPLEFALFLKWAPDSRRIVYQWGTEEGRYELRVLDIENPKPRVLYRARKFKEEYIHPFDWSPDGRCILMGIYRVEDGRLSYISQLALISVADGSAKTLMNHLDTRSDPKPWGFAFSPDGKYIAYDAPVVDKDDNPDIFLLSVEDGQEVSLVDHPSRDTVIGWLPGGAGLLFGSDRTGTNDMWFIRTAEGRPQGNPQLIKSNIGNTVPLGITSKGALYYGLSGYLNDVYEVAIDPRSGTILNPAKKAVLKDEGSNAFPDYSSDGRSLAYIFSPRGPGRPSDPTLRIRSLETGRIRELRPDLASFSYPRWAPDDRYISVEGSGKDGRQGIYRVEIGTGDVVPIVLIDQGQTIFSHRWSPDGRSMFYTVGDREGKTGSLFVHRFDTGLNDLLSGSPADAHDIDISPDGKWLVFLNRTGKRTIRIMPTSGGAPREIYGFDHMERRIITPAWSADGRYIYFSKLPSITDLWEFYRISAEGGEALKLDLAMGGFRHLSVHPDAKRIAFSSEGPNYGQAQVWVMENFLPPLPAATEKTLNVRMIWSGSEAKNVIQVSPDGTSAAFIDEDTGNLCVKDITSGRESVVVRRDPSAQPYEFPVTARWSPDGRRLAYAWFNKDNSVELRMVGIDGSGPRTLYAQKNEVVAPMSWSPDGRTIAVALLRDFYKSYNVGLISAEDGSLRTLKTATLPQVPPKSMTFSRDGRFLILDPPQRDGAQKRDIYALPVGGGQEMPVVEHPADDTLLGWVPGSDSLVFSSDRTGTTDAWVVDIADGRPLGEPRLVRSHLGQVSPLGISRDGSLVYSHAIDLWHVCTASVDLDQQAVIEPSRILPQPLVGADHQPQWSPDGKSLVFYSIGKAAPGARGPMTLKIRTEATGETREVKTDLQWISRPSWAPDGRSLFVIGSDGKNNLALFQLQIETGQTTFLVNSEPGANIKFIAPARDGKSVFYTYFEFGKKRSRIMSIDLATRELRELYRQDAPPDVGGLNVSPNGKELLFKTAAPDDMQVLKAIPLPGGPPREVIRAKSSAIGVSLGVHGAFCWTPDGKRILFFRDVRRGQEKKSELCYVPAEGGDIQGCGLIVEGSPNDLSLHPDGRRLAYSVSRSAAEIWIMENFLPAMKK